MRGLARIAALAVVLAAVACSLGTADAARQGSVEVRSVWSPALGHDVRTLVYLPPSYDPQGPRLPTLYLLHGTPGTPDGLFALGVGSVSRRPCSAGGTSATGGPKPR